MKKALNPSRFALLIAVTFATLSPIVAGADEPYALNDVREDSDQPMSCCEARQLVKKVRVKIKDDCSTLDLSKANIENTRNAFVDEYDRTLHNTLRAIMHGADDLRHGKYGSQSELGTQLLRASDSIDALTRQINKIGKGKTALVDTAWRTEFALADVLDTCKEPRKNCAPQSGGSALKDLDALLQRTEKNSTDKQIIDLHVMVHNMVITDQIMVAAKKLDDVYALISCKQQPNYKMAQARREVAKVCGGVSAPRPARQPAPIAAASTQSIEDALCAAAPGTCKTKTSSTPPQAVAQTPMAAPLKPAPTFVITSRPDTIGTTFRRNVTQDINSVGQMMDNFFSGSSKPQ